MFKQAEFTAALARIRETATARDVAGTWPATELADLHQVGAMRWAIPAPWGDGVPSLELHTRYEQIAAASLSVALILTQRDSAVQLIEQSEGYAGREQLLESLANDQAFATIGISQLTTSHQRNGPALIARPADDGFVLNGLIPWATGAAHSDFIVAGAVLPDRRQILFCLPRTLPGVTVDPPAALVALASTWTTQIHLNEVHLGHAHILRGPAENVLSNRKKGVPFGQVFLALGLCQAAVDLIAGHRSDAGARSVDAFERELEQLRKRVLFLSSPQGAQEAPAAAAVTRADVNDLAIRASHAAVALYKGSALLSSHPAQRLAREAMFLLVWSCPGPVIDCTLDRLLEC